MNHVHWWLFGLSFAVGLILTLSLIITSSAKRQAPVRIPKIVPAESEPPTTKIPVTEQRTTTIPVTEQRTTKIPVTEQRTTKIPIAKELPTAKIPVSQPTPYGPGSADATPDGNGPLGWLVKGRSDSKLYYTPDDPTYDPTIAQVWFEDEKSAERAGFTPWRTRSESPPPQ
jgi:uncharacterized membrane protein ArfC